MKLQVDKIILTGFILLFAGLIAPFIYVLIVIALIIYVIFIEPFLDNNSNGENNSKEN
ncbi:MAG: hypothetical protein QHH13_05110 [Melioribacter sp.]|uniref:hypothetical protein n=1 Tax=Rosettibacter primus TaxID=3111523 RepID=UPI00247BEC3F|nr:hypothetical protein [Melioribacter sp.]